LQAYPVRFFDKQTYLRSVLDVSGSWKYKSFTEKVGFIVVAPFVVLLCPILLLILILAYPIIGVVILFNGEGSLLERIKLALLWPLGVLALNDFLSLGGLDNRFLTRVTELLKRAFPDRPAGK